MLFVQRERDIHPPKQTRHNSSNSNLKAYGAEQQCRFIKKKPPMVSVVDNTINFQISFRCRM